MVALENVSSAKSTNAVVPEVVGSTAVSTPPPAVYPVPLVSLVVAYAVVSALSVADDVYKAILNVSPEEASKSCAPSISSFLNEVHIKFPLKAISKSPN